MRHARTSGQRIDSAAASLDTVQRNDTAIGRRSVLNGLGAVAVGTALAGCLGGRTGSEPDLRTTPAATEFDAVVDVE